MSYKDRRPLCRPGNVPATLPTCVRHPEYKEACAEWFCIPSESKALAESEREYSEEIVQYAGYPHDRFRPAPPVPLCPYPHPLPSVGRPIQIVPFTPLYRKTLPTVPSLIGGREYYDSLTESFKTRFPGESHAPRAGTVQTDWDGVTLVTAGLDPTQLEALVFPGGYMRGLHQLYNCLLPFADPFFPTQLEIEYWNWMVYLHVRRMLGVVSPVVNDRCKYIQAQQYLEHLTTNLGTGGWQGIPAPDPYFGPYPNPNPIAGTPTFDCASQIPYNDNPGAPCCTYGGYVLQAELSSGLNWSNLFARMVLQVLRYGLSNPNVNLFLNASSFGVAYSRRHNMIHLPRVLFTFS